MKYLVILDVEPKDTENAEYPSVNSLVSRLNDVLQDVTKHDEQIGWRVNKVERLDASVLS